jgi:SAM-dependent methyltransferase
MNAAIRRALLRVPAARGLSLAVLGHLPWISNRKVFTAIYRNRRWQAGASVSGPGSEIGRCEHLVQALPRLLRELNAASVLDAGCGDFNWLSAAELPVDYTGVDVVPELIERNRSRYAAPHRRFLVADITSDPLPAADVALCRHALIHLPNRQVLGALQNFRRCGMHYLLATTFPSVTRNIDIVPGSFRPVNLQAAPFGLPAPLRVIDDSGPVEAVLGLWEVKTLP